MCDGLEHFLMSLPHPFQWLEDKLNAIPLTGELTAHPWYQALLRHAPVEVEGLMALWDRQEQCFGEPDASGRLPFRPGERPAATGFPGTCPGGKPPCWPCPR